MDNFILSSNRVIIKGDEFKIYKKEIDDGFTYVYPRKLRDYGAYPENVNFIDVIPGVGKTYWATDTITEGVKNKDMIYIFMAPTINLINEVYKALILKFKKQGLDETLIKQIYGVKDKDVSLKISNSFIHELKGAELGQVFLITHSLYMNIIELPRKKEIFAIFDEAQSFGITTEEFNPKPDDLETLKKHLLLEPIRHKKAHLKIKGNFESTRIEPYFKVHGRESDIVKYKKTGNTSFAPKYLKFLKRTVHKKLDVYMIRKQSGSSYSFFSFSSPKHTFEGFRKVYLMGAFFKHSELYHVLEKHHTLESKARKLAKRVLPIRKRFKKLVIIPILKNLDVDYQSDNILSKSILNKGLIYSGDELTLKKLKKDFTEAYSKVENYLGSNKRQDNLKTFRALFLQEPMGLRDEDTSSENGDIEKELCSDTEKSIETILEPLRKKYSKTLMGLFNHLVSTAENDLSSKSKPLAIVNTKYLKTTACKKIKPENILTSSVHGLNKYSSMNTLIFLAAMRPNTTVIRFYEEFIRNYRWQDNLLAANIVQALCRLSIRDCESKEITYLYVPTEDTANAVSSVLFDTFSTNLPTITPPLDEKTKILTLSNIIEFEKKPKKINDKFLVKTENEEVQKVLNSRVFYRKSDETYRELDNKMMALKKKLKSIELRKNDKNLKLMQDELNTLLMKLKNRRIYLSAKNKET